MNKTSLIYGIHPVEEAMQSGKTIEKIFLLKTLNKEITSNMLRLARENEVPVQFVPMEKLNRFTMKNHQGVVAIASPVQFFKLSDIIAHTFEQGETPLLLVCDRITDVRNFGAICRTAWGCGVHAILIPFTETSALNEDAMKSSAGFLSSVSI